MVLVSPRVVLADKYCQTGLREVTGVLQSQCLVGVNSAVEGQRVKLRFAGASCQSEQPWSSVAMVTSEVVGRPAKMLQVNLLTGEKQKQKKPLSMHFIESKKSSSSCHYMSHHTRVRDPNHQ